MRSYLEQVEVRAVRDDAEAPDVAEGVPHAAGSESLDGVTRAPVPSMFVWHGRLYVVRQVLDRWREPLPWWRSVTHDASREATAGATCLRLAALEQQVWRVTASAGRCLGVGTYDLAWSPSSPSSSSSSPASSSTSTSTSTSTDGTWTLLRVLD